MRFLCWLGTALVDRVETWLLLNEYRMGLDSLQRTVFRVVLAIGVSVALVCAGLVTLVLWLMG